MLTIENISLIEEEVRNSGVSFSHLADELIDHLCCDVEYRMNKGESFEEAFNCVKEKIGIEGLKRIEDQTILFINQNYIKMKKALVVLSIVTVSLVFVSGLFKILHFPAANIILSLGILGLLFGFIPLLFITRIREDRERKMVFVNYSGWLASTVFLLSIYFGLMHWPGKSYLVLLSWIFILLFFLPSYLVYALKLKDFEKKLSHIAVILLISVLMVFEIVFTVIRSRSTIYFNDTVTVNTSAYSDYYEGMNDILLNRIRNDSTLVPEFKEKLGSFISRGRLLMDELDQLAMEIEKYNDFTRIRMKDKIPTDYYERISSLNENLNKYPVEVSSLFTLSPGLTEVMNKTFNLGKDEAGSLIYVYHNKSLVVVRNNLLCLRKDLLFIENEILREASAARHEL